MPKATKKPLVPEKSVDAAVNALVEIASDPHKYEPKTRIEAARELLRYASGTEGATK
jgi:hypothetical protein